MNDWQSLKNIFFTLLLLVASLFLIAGLVAANQASLLIPTPDKTAEDFVGALAAHRYTGAAGELSQDLQKQVSKKDLQQIVQAIETSHQGIEDAHGQGSQEQGQEATAQVQVKLWDKQESRLDFPLLKENGVWKVSSVAPLQALAGGSTQ